MFKFKNKKNSRVERRAFESPVMRNQYLGDVRGSKLKSPDLSFNANKSPRVKIKKLNNFKKLSKRIFYIALAVIAMIFIWWLSLISTKKYYYSSIQNVNISQGYRDNLQGFSSSKLNGYTMLNLDSKKVEAQILENFSDVKSVRIKPVWYRKGVDISYVMREPIIKWQAGNELKFIDEDGFILSLMPKSQDGLYTIDDNSGLSFDNGEKVFAQRNITFCGIAVGAINRNDLVKNQFNGFSIPANSLKEIDIKLKGGLVAKLSTELDPEDQISLLAQIIDRLAKDAKTPSGYIDLRVPGKVFWK
jgi:cell division septal protein FtsQ